ncbi:MAG: SRPBCC family protein [Chloroflexia bacterium]
MTYRIQCSVRINAPREQVWNILQDFTRRKEWDVRVARAKVTTLPPTGIGTRFLITYKIALVSFTNDNEYIVWKPPERSAIRFPDDTHSLLFSSAAGSWRLTSHDDGATIWTTTISIAMRGGFLAPLFERIAVGWYFRRLTEQSQRDLKKLVEREPVYSGKGMLITD